MLYVSDIISRFNGKLLCGDENMILDNFCKDTRIIKNGDIYVGIKGESFDGNNFYADAFDKGAKACILDNTTLVDTDRYGDKTIILVDNTLECIGKLAKYKRSLLNIPVVAITGSVGKTSTKDMVASVLSTKYKVLKTEGNNNNNIGLPFTILRYKDEDVMVIEMGMNHFGEISYLTDIVRPTIGVITNIGTAHIGILGSRENILKAKLEIIEGLNGPLIINNDNDIIRNNIKYIESLNDIVTIGIDNDSDYKASDINDDLTRFKINGNDMECDIGNTAFIYNSLVAYSVGSLCDIDVDNIRNGIKNFKLTGNRLEFKKARCGAILIDDTYNASLDSIRSSLEILKNKEAKRRIAVIGDVLEVGDYNEEIHTKIGEELFKSNLDIIVTIGDNTRYTDKFLENKGFDNRYHFNNESESYEFFDDMLRDGDVVLFKASNGMKLKNIVNHLVMEDR